MGKSGLLSRLSIFLANHIFLIIRVKTVKYGYRPKKNGHTAFQEVVPGLLKPTNLGGSCSFLSSTESCPKHGQVAEGKAL